MSNKVTTDNCATTDTVQANDNTVPNSQDSQAPVNEQAIVSSTQEVSGKAQRWFKSFFTANNIAVIGILTAISFILYAFVKFPLPIFPSFLDIQISDLPALLGGFALGPVAGSMIIIVKCCLKMLMTTTACVGELGDIIIGLSFVIPASLMYHANKCKRNAIAGLLVGSLTAVIMSLFSNWLILIPFYVNAYGMDAIIGMVSSLYEGVTADTFMNYYLPLAVIPFNILRCSICAVLTYLTYKPLSKALHWEFSKRKPNTTDDRANPPAKGETGDTVADDVTNDVAADVSDANATDTANQPTKKPLLKRIKIELIDTTADDYEETLD